MSAFDKAWSLLKQEGKPTLPPCPHCGHVDHDYDYNPGGLHTISCPEPHEGGCGRHGEINDEQLSQLVNTGSLVKQQFPGFPYDPQGPLAQALARERPPQQPLQITNLPPRNPMPQFLPQGKPPAIPANYPAPKPEPMEIKRPLPDPSSFLPPYNPKGTVQSQLPTELTQGAHVAPFKIFGQQ